MCISRGVGDGSRGGSFLILPSLRHSTVKASRGKLFASSRLHHLNEFFSQTGLAYCSDACYTLILTNVHIYPGTTLLEESPSWPGASSHVGAPRNMEEKRGRGEEVEE